jgi:hypothetical protein
MAVTGLIDSVYAGNQREIRYTVIDQDNGGVAKDLTGISARWALARLSTSGDPITATPVVTKDSANGSSEINITDPTNGKLSVFLLGTDSEPLAGDFYFELELYIDSTPFTLVVATGTLTVLKNVVNP